MSEPQTSHVSSSAPVRRSRAQLPLDVVRGGLMGTAELVPGVSGGTVALVTGVYDALIDSASHVVGAGKALVTGPERVASARSQLRRTDWWLVLPVLLGMAVAVLTVAGPMESFVHGQPEHARGLFFGLVAASIVVPLRMRPPRPAGGSPWPAALIFVAGAVLAFVLVSLAGAVTVDDPAPYLVFGAAAVAICALVVPGVSGSFFLLAIGLYAPTLAAVDERDLGYLAVFAAGALVGLASFVPLLRWLLDTRRRVTLLAMAGLMLGSLRALWPWQSTGGGDSDVGAVVVPVAPIVGPVLLALLGAGLVAVLIVVEARSHRHAG